ncbi:MAG: septum formation protein Maf [Lachnospiraceae bacterium]|nr:septum formation protein Maf [Lachnospiraceae bacterium]
MIKFILASGSPRRKELLGQIGISFEIMVADGEEIITKTLPSEIVEELSYEKAAEVADRYEADSTVSRPTVIIGADTIVALGTQIMGKPKDEADAVRMLSALQNNTHQVYTGVTLIVLGLGDRRVIRFHEKTDVMMYPMTKEQIQAYVDTKDPMDKAGSYGIQGRCAAYIKGIVGDYNNVVGLPVGRLYQELVGQGLIN